MAKTAFANGHLKKLKEDFNIEEERSEIELKSDFQTQIKPNFDIYGTI